MNFTEHKLAAVGVYDGYDSIVDYYYDESEFENFVTGYRVVEHEATHFFQNFFTAQGQSYYWIIRLINAAVDDLLNECKGSIVLPFLPWLQSPDSPFRSTSAIKSIDRLKRLLVQLNTAGMSHQVVNNSKEQLQNINIVNAVSAKRLSLNVVDRTFCINGQPVFPIDYSAICESMAKAMEYSNASTNITREVFGLTNVSDVTQFPEDFMLTWRQQASDLAETECRNPLLINYTFPLLLLLQSGFNFEESLHITILLSYIALMWQWSIPGVPELGSDALRRFGTVASDAYVKLLDAACKDEFVEAIDSAMSVIQSGGSVVWYLDQLSSKAGIGNVSPKIEGFSEYLGSIMQPYADDNNTISGNDWYLHIVNVAQQFIHTILSESLIAGTSLITSPFQFLYERNAGPLIVRRSGYSNFKQSPSAKLSEQITFCYTMRFNKVILFGNDLNFQWAYHSKENEQEIRDMFFEYLNKRFKISSVRVGNRNLEK